MLIFSFNKFGLYSLYLILGMEMLKYGIVEVVVESYFCI